jgi:L,D-transpeptidase catalytic domain
MQVLSRAISTVSLVLLLAVTQVIHAANTHNTSATPVTEYKAKATGEYSLEIESSLLYDEMSLGEIGLAKKAFEYAYKGYRNLLERGLLAKQNIISVIDFSQSSKNKRLYIIDVENKQILMNTFVAHGRNSGKEFATSFSNTMSSLKSSLGFFVTGETYYGEHGLSLRIDGVERGINDNAGKRAVVIHGADYLGERYLNNNLYSGRSWGCPAVPSKLSGEIIDLIKDGSVVFIYHPTQKYLSKSRILNG